MLMGSRRTGKLSKKVRPSRLLWRGVFILQARHSSKSAGGVPTPLALNQQVRTLASGRRQRMVRNTHSEEGD
jgi:hypothetical protein